MVKLNICEIIILIKINSCKRCG